MLLLLTVAVVVCFLASLLPVLFPGTLIAMMGGHLNAWLGEHVAALAPQARGTLVLGERGSLQLTFLGVLAVYAPVILLLLWGQRGR
jgi:hypothetical protein